MVDDTEGEISVRGSPALTAEFFYVMRGMMLAASCQKQLGQAASIEERRNGVREGKAALSSVEESLQRIPELLRDSDLSADAQAMFSETLANQRDLFEAARANFAAALRAHGLADDSG